MMATLLSVLLSIAALTLRPLPQGTQLHVRLTAPVGSYASTPGSPVSAVLIAPLIMDGETVLPAGSTLAGRVKSVTRVGFGLRHETAGLDLEFSQITSPDGETIPISTQVADVDNGRERVTRDGRIQGVRSTGSLMLQNQRLHQNSASVGDPRGTRRVGHPVVDHGTSGTGDLLSRRC